MQCYPKLSIAHQLIKMMFAIFLFFSCDNELVIPPLPAPITYQDIGYYKGFPVLEFTFTQRLGEKEGDNVTNLKIKNISNSKISTIEYIVSVFKSNEKIIENYEYFFTDSIKSQLMSGDTTSTILLSKSSNLIIKQELVEIGIISLGNTDKFSNVYQGEFISYSDTLHKTEDIILSNIANGFITAEGYVNLKLAGNSAVKTVQGFIGDDNLISGEALQSDGTKLSDLKFYKEASLVNDTLRLELLLDQLPNQENIKLIELSLLPI